MGDVSVLGSLPVVTLPYLLQLATFVERPNRFVAVVALCNEEGQTVRVKAHVPDPGRLKELFLPGVQVLIQDHGAETKRKLRYTLEMVKAPTQHWVSVNTHLPNRLIRLLLEAHNLPGFEPYLLLKPEFTYGKSRVDFLLQNPTGAKCLLEIKSCTLVEEGHALFPDAPTERGSRHLEELVTSLQEGYEAQVLFVIQRADAVRFSPNHRTDPLLARTLQKAILAGVTVRAYCFEMDVTPQGGAEPDRFTVCCRFIQEVPVVLPEAV